MDSHLKGIERFQKCGRNRLSQNHRFIPLLGTHMAHRRNVRLASHFAEWKFPPLLTSSMVSVFVIVHHWTLLLLDGILICKKSMHFKNARHFPEWEFRTIFLTNPIARIRITMQ
jgi:hypothetical protein